jgi:hypothetical protein
VQKYTQVHAKVGEKSGIFFWWGFLCKISTGHLLETGHLLLPTTAVKRGTDYEGYGQKFPDCLAIFVGR